MFLITQVRGTGLENQEFQATVHLPIKTLESLKKEFNLTEAEIEGFIAASINRMIEEHVGETNSRIFSKTETKELEDDLKGLGYI